MRRVLVTGGAGFIGSNFVRYWLAKNPTDRVINLDQLTYAGNLANLNGLPADQRERYTFVRGDIRNLELAGICLAWAGRAMGNREPTPGVEANFPPKPAVDI